MPDHNIFIFGNIFNDQSDYAKEWGVVSLTDVKNQIKEAPAGTTDLIVHIHSGGGDVFEGFAIHDYLINSGFNVTTKIEGLCASIATIVALAGSKRTMTENSTFMIHNPVMGFAMGDSDELAEQAEFLREIEDKIINFYSKKTSQSKDVLDAWMKDEKFMTPQEAKELGFITDIVEELKAVAYYPMKRNHNKNDNNMNTLLNTLNDKISQILNKLGVEKPVNELKLSTADGKTILIQTDASQPAVNDKIKLEDGNIADGDYLLPDGDKLSVANGIITGITTKEGEPTTEATQNDVILQLQNEVSSLRNENQALSGQLSQLSNNMTLLLDNIESEFVPPARDASFVKKDKKTVVTDSAPNFSEALTRLREKESKK